MQASHQFLGPSWNLLTNNCNHFTSYLCKQLTGKAAPAWLNRAAKIGVKVPCFVPEQMLEPPNAETADGELVEDDEEADESTSMLKSRRRHPAPEDSDEETGDETDDDLDNTPYRGSPANTSTSGGKKLHVSEGFNRSKQRLIS